MNRKVFIKTTGRILILGGLAAGAVYLVATQKVDTACSGSQACQKCGQFNGCKLPQAIRTRQNGQLHEKAVDEKPSGLKGNTNTGS